MIAACADSRSNVQPCEGARDVMAIHTVEQTDEYESREMTQRPLVGLYFLPFLTSAVHGLNFTGSPAGAQQCSGFIAAQPSGARRVSGRQYHAHGSAVKSLFGVMVDGSAEVFEVASSTAGAVARLHVCAASLSGDFREPLVTPELIQAFEATIELGAISSAADLILIIDREYIGERNLLYVAFFPDGLVFRGDVVGELALRRCNFVRSTSCGDVLFRTMTRLWNGNGTAG
jgi:hypothetical protein